MEQGKKEKNSHPLLVMCFNRPVYVTVDNLLATRRKPLFRDVEVENALQICEAENQTRRVLQNPS